MPSSPAPSPTVAQRRSTIPITCCLDGRTHDVTEENVAAGRDSGKYLAPSTKQNGQELLAPGR